MFATFTIPFISLSDLFIRELPLCSSSEIWWHSLPRRCQRLTMVLVPRPRALSRGVREKPDLQFIRAQDFTDEEIVAAIVAEFDGAARRLAGLQK
jgi:hypothetical protein